MPQCMVCGGSGRETYDEDGRTVSDACYHCAESGEVDEETHRHDQLKVVAYALAYREESEYKAWCNSGESEDPYYLHAAENGMHEYEYFRMRVWDRGYDIHAKLLELPQEGQDLLIAWNDYVPEPGILERPVADNPVPPLHLAKEGPTYSEDDIPF